MTSIQKWLTQEIERLPRRFLENLIARKLKAEGVCAADKLAPKLLEHTLSGSNDKYHWDDDDEPSRDVTITLTMRDLEEIKRGVDDFVKNGLPEIIRITSERSATLILASLKKNWPDQYSWEKETFAIFQANLENRWGKGLALLRMLLTICREIGDKKQKHYFRSKRQSRSHLTNVLFRLHARACQVSGEIIVLLESGFADGAMARWRTLYEIGVVATVIADYGEEIAERYVAHEIVETKSGMDEYMRCSVLLGYKPISPRERSKVIKRYNAVIAQFGNEFVSPYGWAAHHLNQKRPTFRDLEVVAGRVAMRSYYKMASYNVHASAKGIFCRLGLLNSSEVIAGASNAGFTDPGQNAAITLTAITLLLFGPRWTFDDIVQVRVLANLRDEIPGAFQRADRQLRIDDARYRNTPHS